MELSVTADKIAVEGLALLDESGGDVIAKGTDIMGVHWARD